MFLSVSASIVPIIYFFFPETMGRSLEELEMMFSESGSIITLVRKSRQLSSGSLVSEYMIEKGKIENEVIYIE